jgi:hypothetical protein
MTTRDNDPNGTKAAQLALEGAEAQDAGNGTSNEYVTSGKFRFKRSLVDEFRDGLRRGDAAPWLLPELVPNVGSGNAAGIGRRLEALAPLVGRSAKTLEGWLTILRWWGEAVESPDGSGFSLGCYAKLRSIRRNEGVVGARQLLEAFLEAHPSKGRTWEWPDIKEFVLDAVDQEEPPAASGGDAGTVPATTGSTATRSGLTKSAMNWERWLKLVAKTTAEVLEAGKSLEEELPSVNEIRDGLNGANSAAVKYVSDAKP